MEYTDGFEQWWNGLSEEQQDSVASRVALLAEWGPDMCEIRKEGLIE